MISVYCIHDRVSCGPLKALKIPIKLLREGVSAAEMIYNTVTQEVPAEHGFSVHNPNESIQKENVCNKYKKTQSVVVVSWVYRLTLGSSCSKKNT